MIEKYEEKLKNQLQEWNAELTGHQLEQLQIYCKNLSEWNKVMDLTAIDDPADVYEKHFLDSMSLLREKEVLKELSEHKEIRLIDVGTGAGFPGLILAILFPKWKITLMDSLNKRIRFLEDTVLKLGLLNVKCIHSRAEDLGRQKEHREMYDLVVSRAVADTRILAEYCLPFVRKGGWFIPYKAQKGREELENSQKAIRILGGKLFETDEFILPGTEYERSLFLIRKEKNTPALYPRKAGTPRKEPL